MRFLVFLFVGAYLVEGGRAQSNDTSAIDAEVNLLPACGLACIHAAVAAAGCGFTDYACMCGSEKDIIREHAIPCITSQCSTSDALKIQPIAMQICVLEAALQNGSSSSNTTAQASSTLSTATSNLSTTLVSSTSTSATSTATSEPSKTPSSTSASTTTLPSSTSAPKSSSIASATNRGLSKGAVVGVAVGASIGGILLLGVIGLLAFGYVKRGKDLKHLAGLQAAAGERKIAGRYELDSVPHVPKGDGHVQNDVT